MSKPIVRKPSQAAQAQWQVAASHASLLGCALWLGADATSVNLMLALELCAVMALELAVERKRRWSERIATLLSALALAVVVMGFAFAFYLMSFPEPWMPREWNGQLQAGLLASRSIGPGTIAGGLLSGVCLLAWPMLAARDARARLQTWQRHQDEGMVTYLGVCVQCIVFAFGTPLALAAGLDSMVGVENLETVRVAVVVGSRYVVAAAIAAVSRASRPAEAESAGTASTGRGRSHAIATVGVDRSSVSAAASPAQAQSAHTGAVAGAVIWAVLALGPLLVYAIVEAQWYLASHRVEGEVVEPGRGPAGHGTRVRYVDVEGEVREARLDLGATSTPGERLALRYSRDAPGKVADASFTDFWIMGAFLLVLGAMPLLGLPASKGGVERQLERYARLRAQGRRHAAESVRVERVAWGRSSRYALVACWRDADGNPRETLSGPFMHPPSVEPTGIHVLADCGEPFDSVIDPDTLPPANGVARRSAVYAAR